MQEEIVDENVSHRDKVKRQKYAVAVSYGVSIFPPPVHHLCTNQWQTQIMK